MPKQGAQTFGHGIRVLMLLADADGPMGLSDIARRLDFHKNVAYRLLNELEAQGLVGREADGRRYIVGVELIALAAKLVQKVSLSGVARPAMQRLRDQTGETVSLHVRQGGSRVCVDALPGIHQISRVVQTGTTLPLYSGPSGKVQLAHLEPLHQEALLTLAGDAGDDVPAMRRQLANVRASGYIAVMDDLTAGISHLSAPIFDLGGVVASMTVSGPADRLTSERLDALAPVLVAECAGISAALGHLPT